MSTHRRMNSNSSMMMGDGIEWDETFHLQVLQEQYQTVSDDSMDGEGNNEIEIEVVPPSSLLHMKRPLSVVVVSPSPSFPPPQEFLDEERETSSFWSFTDRFYPASAVRDQDERGSKLKKKQKMQRRRVNFRMDHQVCESNVILEEKDCNELWWTPVERQAIVNREELLAKDNQEHAKEVAKLWQRCSFAGGFWKRVHSNAAEYASLLGLVCQSDARGLEDDLLPDMQQHQENAVRSILKAQGRFKEERMDPKILSSRLREQYEELSRTAQLFARALGEGDALATKSLNFSGTRLFI